MERVKLPNSALPFIDLSERAFDEVMDEYEGEEKIMLFENLQQMFDQSFFAGADFVNESKKKDQMLAEVDEQIKDTNVRTLKKIEEDLESIQHYKEKAKELVKKYTNKSLKSVIDVQKYAPSDDNLDRLYKNYEKMTQTQIDCLKEANNAYVDLIEKELARAQAKKIQLDRENELLKLLFEPHN